MTGLKILVSKTTQNVGPRNGWTQSFHFIEFSSLQSDVMHFRLVQNVLSEWTNILSHSSFMYVK